MNDRPSEIVKFDNVGLRYGTEPEVLSDVSFTLFPGSFYFLTGASGAGKTSLLKLLYLAQRPSLVGRYGKLGPNAAPLPCKYNKALLMLMGVFLEPSRQRSMAIVYKGIYTA